MRDIDMIVVHCSDTPASMDIGAEEIRHWHVNDNGWSDIGYHYVIRRDGTVELGRDLDGDGDVDEHPGAHAYGFNKYSIGICLIGGKGLFNFTWAQLVALHDLVHELRIKYPYSAVVGHRDLDERKDCPQFSVIQLFKG